MIGIVGVIDGLRLNRLSEEAGDAFGPGWYLILLSLVLIICGFYSLMTTYKGQARKTEPPEEAFPWKGPATFAIVAMILSCVLLPYIGYFLSTTAFLLATTRLFGEKSWIKSALVAGVSGAVFWLFFVYLAKIPMP